MKTSAVFSVLGYSANAMSELITWHLHKDNCFRKEIKLFKCTEVKELSCKIAKIILKILRWAIENAFELLLHTNSVTTVFSQFTFFFFSRSIFKEF